MKHKKNHLRDVFSYLLFSSTLLLLNACGGAASTDPVDDTSPPETSIISSPGAKTDSTTVTFEFISSEAGSSFECSLDGATFSACSSPVSYSAMSSASSYEFRVQAIDKAGNTDPTPARHQWVYDSTVPDTFILFGPDDPTKADSARFEFNSSDPGATFQCALDGNAFEVCSSPRAYSGLVSGQHRFAVQASNTQGNTDASAAVYDWLVDLIPPVTSVSSAPTSPTKLTDASFIFSADDPTATFECSIDASAFSRCVSPQTYMALTEEAHTFRVQAIDSVGNVDLTPAIHGWVVDITPPVSNITSKPVDPTNSTSASFAFEASETGSTFECSMDSAAYESCASAKSYSGMTQGSHIFKLKASDIAGNIEPTPASYSWMIDLTPPETTLDSIPGILTNATTANFAFSSSEAGSGFQCSIDAGSFTSCASPREYTELLQGEHSFEVKAIDPAGNHDSSPATYHWTIDVTPPETAISNGPVSPTNAASASFTFTASESESTFECSIDDAVMAECSSPQSYSGLAEGGHFFSVQATDKAGNTDQTADRYDWIIDITAPVVTAPTGITVIATDSSGISATDFGIQVFLDGATASDNVDGNVTAGIIHDATISFPVGITNVTFSVTDASGNTGRAVSTVEVIEVDTIKPVTSSIAINKNTDYALGVNAFSVRLIASDNVGITAYFISEHNSTDPFNINPPYLDPLISDSGWVSVVEAASVDTTIQHSVAGSYQLDDSVEVCAWFKDQQENMSDRICDSIVYGVSWENGWDNWYADNGVWQVGTPTAGPAACFSGTQCAGTILDGNYPAYTDSRLVSATMTLPAVTGFEELHLRFMQWLSYTTDADSGQVQIQVWDDVTQT